MLVERLAGLIKELEIEALILEPCATFEFLGCFKFDVALGSVTISDRVIVILAIGGNRSQGAIEVIGNFYGYINWTRAFDTIWKFGSLLDSVMISASLSVFNLVKADGFVLINDFFINNFAVGILKREGVLFVLHPVAAGQFLSGFEDDATVGGVSVRNGVILGVGNVRCYAAVTIVDYFNRNLNIIRLREAAREIGNL